MWWPSRAARRGLGLGTCLELGAWDLKLPRRAIPPKTARNRKISRLLIVIHDRYRVSKCLDNRQSSSYFKVNLIGPFVRRRRTNFFSHPFCRINAEFHLGTERRIYAAAKSRALHILNDARDGKPFVEPVTPSTVRCFAPDRTPTVSLAMAW